MRIRRSSYPLLITPLLICACTMLAPFAVSAQSDLDALRRDWVGTTVLLRGFYEGEELTFDRTGQLVGSAEAESWTASQVEIIGILKKDHQCIVTGKRVALQPDANGELKPIYRGRDGEKKQFEPEILKVVVKTENLYEFQEALGQIFIKDGGDWLSVVPKYWRSYLEGDTAEVTGVDIGGVRRTLADGTKVYKVGGSISAPKATYTPDPQYSRAASFSHYMGNATYEIVVDQNGYVRDVQLEKPAGWGLDEDAVRVLRSGDLCLLGITVRWSPSN